MRNAKETRRLQTTASNRESAKSSSSTDSTYSSEEEQEKQKKSPKERKPKKSVKKSVKKLVLKRKRTSSQNSNDEPLKKRQKVKTEQKLFEDDVLMEDEIPEDEEPLDPELKELKAQMEVTKKFYDSLYEAAHPEKKFDLKMMMMKSVNESLIPYVSAEGKSLEDDECIEVMMKIFNTTLDEMNRVKHENSKRPSKETWIREKKKEHAMKIKQIKSPLNEY